MQDSEAVCPEWVGVVQAQVASMAAESHWRWEGVRPDSMVSTCGLAPFPSSSLPWQPVPSATAFNNHISFCALLKRSFSTIALFTRSSSKCYLLPTQSQLFCVLRCLPCTVVVTKLAVVPMRHLTAQVCHDWALLRRLNSSAWPLVKFDSLGCHGYSLHT